MAMSARSSSSGGDLTGQAKLEEVTRLLDKLSSDLQKINLLPHQRDQLLEQLKVLGRDPANADPIFTPEGIETLTRHAFNSPSKTTSRNALRCLANALLLRPSTRQIFVDLGYESKMCLKLKNDSRDDEFLVSRIIFLTTYDTNINIEKLIDQHHVAEHICQNITRHAKQYLTKQKKVKELDPMEGMALVESLKLLFNLTHHCPQRQNAFASAVPPILTLLLKRPVSQSKPLDAPIGPLVNALINLPLSTHDNKASLFPKPAPSANIERFTEILDKSLKAYQDDDLEQVVSPLVTLLRKTYETAPREVQKVCQTLLLPSQAERNQPLGRSLSLSGRLLRLSTNPGTPQVREQVSQLLFELSGKDATRFVRNVGYGFASGFLFQHNISVPENALEAYSTASSADSVRSGFSDADSTRPINPITGQRLDMETKIEMPEMTQEEKEQEAEKLFILFDRLKKTGVVSVKNPVEEAFEQGRFLEIEDDAESD
ncbi:hypothetical protein B7463_g9936, partial [Scytalidium lignicola]